MMGSWWCVIAVLAAVCGLWGQAQENANSSPYAWQGYDKFDEITDRMDAVNRENCKSKPANELHLPADSLAQMPKFNKLLSTIIYPNRTDQLHLHNMALNRAFYYSYIFQKLQSNKDFLMQPGLMYYYFSAAADVSANEYNINGSAVMFDNNGTFANWYRNLPFNTTLPLFGPRAYRLDDFNDPTNWLREPTNRTIDILDYGAGPQSNYTHDSYKINKWYSMWLPDSWEKEGQDSLRKHTYDVGIKYSNETGSFIQDEFQAMSFFGPPSPGLKEEEHLPVVFTEPYYDCGRSNKWIISAVSPIVDYLPRYLEWLHLRRFRFVASSVQDMDFLSVDINQCPLSFGNEPPNYFAGTARCKESTMCEPLYGWGFRRGGYQCVCKPGYRYPPWQRGPFQGSDIESATEEEYKDGFECIVVKLRLVLPVIRGNESGTPSYSALDRKKRDTLMVKEKPLDLVELEKKGGWTRPKFASKHDVAAKEMSVPLETRIQNKKMRMLHAMGLEEVHQKNKKSHLVAKHQHSFSPDKQHKKTKKKQKLTARYKKKSKSRQKRQAFDQESWERMHQILEHKETVNQFNCMNYKPEELELPGDVSHGVEKQFSYQARTALRLSHFLSNFLQNVDRYEEYGNLRGDKMLNVEQLFGEAIANVMGDLKIKGSGIFFDVDKFEEANGRYRQYFGPYAYRYEEDTESDGPSGDKANTHFRAIDYAGFPDNYLDEPWFRNVKERWQSNTYGLTKFTEKPMIRSDVEGTSLKRFEMYPMYYEAPNEEDGWWSAPYFDCDNYVNDWVITYSVPFFGLNSIRSSLEFKGVVIVDVKLDELDINQCPQDYYVPNAFKGTARCHYESTFCEHLPSKTFVKGAYKCECRQGYEYPYNDRAWYFDGQKIEEEYRKLVDGLTNKYHTLQCRIGGASSTVPSALLLAALMVIHGLSKLR